MILIRRARNTIFDIDNVLNMTSPPSNVRSLILHKVRTLTLNILNNIIIFFSSFIFWLHEKYIPKTLITSFLKLIHVISQTAAWSPFSTPIPVISHLVVFGFYLEKLENHLNISEKWTMKFSSLNETRNSFKKWHLNLWWISNKIIMEVVA